MINTPPTIIVPIAEYVALRNELDALRAEVARLRMFAPGGRAPHAISMAPHIGPTNFAAWGITPDTEDAAE